jgi:hypothetical protein
MEPYIQSIDTSKDLGRAVKNYGDKQFHTGFMYGLITGVSLTIISFMIVALV